jgi:phage repressor protein C with HTH and peptisase S24 domain
MHFQTEAERFNAVRQKHGLTNKEFGASLGLTEAQVSNIIHGVRKPSRDVLIRLNRLYQADLNWIIAGNTEYADTEKTVYVERIRQEAAAGNGAEIDDYAEKTLLSVPASLIFPHKPHSIRAVTVHGDSMTGEKIFDGDIVLFNIYTVTGDGIFVLSVGSTLLVKRVAFDEFNRSITLISANPYYAPRILAGAELESAKIEGKVIANLHRE